MTRASAVIALSLLMLLGCSGGDPLARCVEVDPECAPLYQPTFDELYARTLEPTCGIGGAACHTREGAQNGLVFADPDEAYELLLGGERVVPGDPGCSLLVKRLETDNPNLQMPPGDALSEAERCVVVRWIDDGAER